MSDGVVPIIWMFKAQHTSRADSDSYDDTTRTHAICGTALRAAGAETVLLAYLDQLS